MSNRIDDVFDVLEKSGTNVSPAQKERILERITDVVDYIPKVGVFGKTGVGKSSLTNSLFGQDVCSINDVTACTRDTQEVLLGMGKKTGLSLIDVPGVGESAERDKEYALLYQKILPEIDIVLWVLKGDDRAFSSDESFYRHIVKPHLEQGKPFLIALNQVDKVEPFREWSVPNRCPGDNQLLNISRKVKNISDFFNIPESKVIPVSANEQYNLIKLVDEIVYSLPPQQLLTFVNNVKPELVSNATRSHIESKTGEYILSGAAFGANIGAKVAGPVGAAVGAVAGAAVGAIRAFFS